MFAVRPSDLPEKETFSQITSSVSDQDFSVSKGNDIKIDGNH